MSFMMTIARKFDSVSKNSRMWKKKHLHSGKKLNMPTDKLKMTQPGLLKFHSEPRNTKFSFTMKRALKDSAVSPDWECDLYFFLLKLSVRQNSKKDDFLHHPLPANLSRSDLSHFFDEESDSARTHTHSGASSLSLVPLSGHQWLWFFFLFIKCTVVMHTQSPLPLSRLGDSASLHRRMSSCLPLDPVLGDQR